MVTSELKLHCQATNPSHCIGYCVYHLVFIQGGMLRIWKSCGLLWTSNEPSVSIKFRVFLGYLRTLPSPAYVCSMQMAVIYLRAPPVAHTVGCQLVNSELKMTGQKR